MTLLCPDMQAPFLEGLGRYGRGQEREDVGDGEADQEELVVHLL